jgi:hypothetical protein
MTAGRRRFFERSEYEALVVVFPEACSAPRVCFVHPKRVSITFPADGCIWNFLSFDDEE